jgi:hypothetical protein
MRVYSQPRFAFAMSTTRSRISGRVRGVADRLLKVLIAMLRDQSTYESARRKSLPKTV